MRAATKWLRKVEQEAMKTHMRNDSPASFLGMLAASAGAVLIVIASLAAGIGLLGAIADHWSVLMWAFSISYWVNVIGSLACIWLAVWAGCVAAALIECGGRRRVMTCIALAGGVAAFLLACASSATFDSFSQLSTTQTLAWMAMWLSFISYAVILLAMALGAEQIFLAFGVECDGEQT